MSLEEDLKARTLALISQQMANWVVEIQRQIGGHQANLMRALDELQEGVARYDEKINEADIEMAMAEVVASQPPPEPVVAPAPAGPGLDRLKAAMAAVDHGTNLSEVLTFLVNEVSQQVERAAMFIVKGPNAIGWYARGVHPPDAIKQVSVPLAADTVFRQVQGRVPFVGHISQSHGTAQALARLGGSPGGVLAVPLVLRDKLAAILYCDTSADAIPAGEADLIEILVHSAAKTIDLISLGAKPAVPAHAPAAPAPRPAPAPAARPAAAAHADDGSSTIMMPRAPAAPSRPPAPAAPPADEGSSTVMFSASQFAGLKPAAPAPAPPPPAGPAIPPEEQKAHDDAKRFARLVVSEIKLYNEAKVNEGRRNKDVYERLKEDIERGRAMYTDRVPAGIRDKTNYFYDELVRILAGGDAGALGPM
ncbi:MAG: hypothetical protein AB7O37_23210 [Vicinamibacteria bacterium]